MIEIVDLSSSDIDIIDFEPQGPAIERDRNGRPKIYSTCFMCLGEGRLPSQKREGKTVQCKACKGEKVKGAYYSRTTTFIDVLDDKTNLADWKQRMVILGMIRKPELLEEFKALEDPTGADKQAANAIADKAKNAADADLKAELGSALHKVTEDIDAGEDPGFIPDDFVNDIKAYAEATKDLEVIGIETFSVLDEYRVAGTFDRLVRVTGELAERIGVPSGSLLIADIKTGGIDFGRGKIAMQLAAYSRMKSYDPQTFERGPLTDRGDVNQDVALIIHMPSGEGRCEIVTVNIAEGWKGMSLARTVRDWRNHWQTKAAQGEVIASASFAGVVQD